MTSFPSPDWPEVEKLALSDGRTLAFRKMGDVNGTPILFFHGTPGTHTLGYMASDAAKRAGYCLIAPDRPGLGDSTFQPEREHRHYPLDIVQLFHHLNIEQCGIIAISGGAPYAFQCAYDLPEKISFIASLSGWLCYGREEAKGIELPKQINGFKWMYRSSLATKLVGKLSNYVIKQKIEKIEQHLQHSLPASDLEILAKPFYRNLFLYDLQRAYQQGWQGPALDGEMQFRDQAFPLSAIKQPVILLHGTADSIVPYTMAEAMAKHLPNVKAFITTKKGGHLCAVIEEDRVFEAIGELS